MTDVPESEYEMAKPTLTLFPNEEYLHFEQISLGRKKIDLVCLKKSVPFTITIELKIQDWRRALWQANLNMQVSDEAYIAIWHSFVHRATKHTELFAGYGIGLISVNEDCAEVVLDSHDPVRRIPRSKKRQWYEQLIKGE